MVALPFTLLFLPKQWKKKQKEKKFRRLMADPSVDDLLTFYSGRVIFKSPSPARRLGAAEKRQRGESLQRAAVDQ